MNETFSAKKLIKEGLPISDSEKIEKKINHYLENLTSEMAWKHISTEILNPSIPFQCHLYLFSQIFPEWPEQLDSAPAYIPDPAFIKTTNIAKSMVELKINTLKEFHTWSVNHFMDFWQYIIAKLGIHFDMKPQKICDLSQGVESPQWLCGAKLNIVKSCFLAPAEKTAVIFLNKKNQIEKMTYAELNHLSNRIANSLTKNKFSVGDSIAIYMPMTVEAVAIYLGIIKMGGVVVSIADSFTAEEVAIRLRIAKTKAIFTQDFILRDNKKLPLYEKVIAANAPITIVLPSSEQPVKTLRMTDLAWQDFLLPDDHFTPRICDPMTHINILFSSGTTGDPKAIPWNHTTGIKSASDAYFHQNIQADDILCWPTNLGWMMGPWVIFSAFINQATLAIYHDAPKDQAFGKFVQDAKVTMLGLVPALVATWRQSGCMQALDWQTIKRFSSTGECSNASDMLYLMSLAGYKPIIEYCGGTETGGGYLSSTLIENNYTSVFTTPVMGLDFVILDEAGQIADNGEVALVPPAMGLSTELLNSNHHQVYYDGMPKLNDGTLLRRHGDQAQRFDSGYFCVLGRVDDTMKLGGIKTSSAEIERAIAGINGINETAAIAVSPHQGPSLLVIYAVTTLDLSKNEIKIVMQTRINQHLNPLFKIHDVIFIKELPKTASNKIMRRVLRKEYQSNIMEKKEANL